MPRLRDRTEAYSAGTLAGAGSFRCNDCGFAVALHELDEIPSCPHCGGQSFRRSSIFGGQAAAEPWGGGRPERPEWLDDVRDALTTEGHYLAYHDDQRVHVVPLDEGWTRVGRSLAAHVRLDDPTVSRRHALIHREGDAARVLDDRSLNGLFVNRERVEWHSLDDGDEMLVGRFRIYFVSLIGERAHEPPARAGTAVS